MRIRIKDRKFLGKFTGSVKNWRKYEILQISLAMNIDDTTRRGDLKLLKLNTFVHLLAGVNISQVYQSRC